MKLYIGTATASDVLELAKSTDPKEDREQHCEGYFYLGERALIQKNRAKAIELFKAALDTRLTTFIEYEAAAVELRRLSR